jgi:hypothetical protein
MILDLIIGNILRHFYFTQVAGENFRSTYAIDSTNADILVFGSSRANHHYVPEIFEKGLKMSFYNTGRDGNFLLYNYAVFKSIIKRYSPKIVIFDITLNELNYEVSNYDRLASLLPYWRNHPEIRSIVKMRSPYEEIKIISSVYPFNSSILTIGVGNLVLNKNRKSDRKGYVPLTNNLRDTALEKMEIEDEKFDINKVHVLNNIVNTCLEKKIKLFIVQSPVYARISPSKANILIESIAKKGKAKYLSFSNDPVFSSKPYYFQDQNHLNEIGANYFSKILVNKIIIANLSFSIQYP